MRHLLTAWLIVVLSFLSASGTVALAQPSPQIIDVHFHARPGWDVDALVSLFNELGVDKAAGGPAGPDYLGLSFASRHPDRFIPFGGQGSLAGLIWKEGAAIWNLQSPRIEDYLRLLERELKW